MEKAVILDNEIKVIQSELDKLNEIALLFTTATDHLRGLHGRLMYEMGNREKIFIEDCSLRYDGAYIRFLNSGFEVRLGINIENARKLAFDILQKTERN